MSKHLPIRKIIHIDMDAFYASVEQLDFPELKGKPIAVGGSEKRGVVAAASYEARVFGVRSAMSSVRAKALCKDLIFIKPRFERYKSISQQIRKIFFDYTDLVEPLSLDEAYLDVTTNKKGHPSASLLAKDIRQRIFNDLKLNASAGISINKFLAKVASDINKPNGQKTIEPHEVLDFLEQLDIRKFHGIGKVTAEKMYNLGIFNGKDLKAKSKDFLLDQFGKTGAYYYDIVRGIQKSEVKPNRIRKSLAAERTFEQNLSSELFMLDKLDHIATEVAKRLKQHELAGKTITLKIKYSDFKMQTRSKTLPYFINEKSVILDAATSLLYQDELKNSVRLLGISLSNFNTESNKNKTTPSQKNVTVQLKLAF